MLFNFYTVQWGIHKPCHCRALCEDLCRHHEGAHHWCWKVHVSGNKSRLERTQVEKEVIDGRCVLDSLWAYIQCSPETIQDFMTLVSIVPGLVSTHHLQTLSCNMPPSNGKKWSLLPLNFQIMLVQYPRLKICCCLAYGLEHSLWPLLPPLSETPEKAASEAPSQWALMKASICPIARCRAASSPPQRLCHIKLLLTLINSA